jgi:prepilin-type N-terminal cleavage/methylation domain-containing protein
MHRLKSAGFTLVEIIIVVAIIGIASTMVFSSFAEQRGARTIDRAAREVVAALREAQNYTLTGRAGTINENNTYYGIQIASATGYNLTSSSGILASYTLKGGVTFTSGATTIAFILPRGDVLQGGASFVGAYRIDLSNGTNSRYICVYSMGRVVDNGANAACP